MYELMYLDCLEFLLKLLISHYGEESSIVSMSCRWKCINFCSAGM